MEAAKLKEILELHKKWINGEEGGVRADLRNAFLSGADLSYADLSYAFLSGADLSYADLRDANLSNATLRNATLSNATLSNADLSNADLSNADLSNANLSGANLRKATLSGADLRVANLDYSCWPLWCGSLGVKADEALVGQLAYHLLALANSSGIKITSIKQLKELANKSRPVCVHGKDKI